MEPKAIVFLGVVLQFILLFVYACLEQHKNNSYIGFIVMYAVSALITGLILIRMIDSGRGK